MKRSFLCFLMIVSLSYQVFGQSRSFSSGRLVTSNGDNISASNIASNGFPVLLVFWDLCSDDCIKQLEALSGIKEEFLNEFGVQLIGIYVANNGNWANIKPLINGKSWDMEFYIDINGELAHTMSIPDLPFTMLYDSQMQLICSHIGFCSGMDELLCEKVKQCLSAEQKDGHRKN
jgi:hypothetical protein